LLCLGWHRYRPTKWLRLAWVRERVDFDGACLTAARKSLWCISARVREVTGCEPTWSWPACRHRYTHDVSPWPSYHDPRRLLLAVSGGRSRDHTPPGRWVGKRERLLISETHRWRCNSLLSVATQAGSERQCPHSTYFQCIHIHRENLQPVYQQATAWRAVTFDTTIPPHHQVGRKFRDTCEDQ
jgi:hypothetical protein